MLKNEYTSPFFEEILCLIANHLIKYEAKEIPITIDGKPIREKVGWVYRDSKLYEIKNKGAILYQSTMHHADLLFLGFDEESEFFRVLRSDLDEALDKPNLEKLLN